MRRDQKEKKEIEKLPEGENKNNVRWCRKILENIQKQIDACNGEIKQLDFQREKLLKRRESLTGQQASFGSFYELLIGNKHVVKKKGEYVLQDVDQPSTYNEEIIDKTWEPIIKGNTLKDFILSEGKNSDSNYRCAGIVTGKRILLFS